MNYSNINEIIKELGLDIEPTFDQSCHTQYIVYLDGSAKPRCDCICNKVLLKDKYCDISNYQMNLPWDEFLKIIDCYSKEGNDARRIPR